ncbi:uncharacterized zinc finger CCHC domain-containing protein At4g19190 [Gossypium raimondii]|uniref:CBF1-interacting co-repressor CIR N-terminal domain-containing protein n=1 Tax=Gossypium raimondii TaxID=29730 RepID=A0A0D2S1I8_GOSRA|nr:uncharacterized zinc finger CCHC domain-containing protein At4g19190 [Gossypium raimondii]KJB25130.1 hypothetical protein B456_004G178000 [Gossypium raimondii]
MDGIGEEGGGIRLRKKFPDDNKPGSSAEVDYKTKAGTAWSHSYLNQKPWHPLSYPNQRRKWIAEQTHAQRVRRADEVAREYSQEQEFFRQTALISKKEKEKVEMMKAVSFMYVRPPGYNAESAKAAEIADERKKTDHNNVSDDHSTDVPSTAMQPESLPGGDATTKEKRKSRPKDVFGRSLPTEEEFEVLKNAPRLETGVPGRVKPFAVEVRNVKCLRCGNYGHQSGDRDCPLKDAIMPNEESRLKRDDPLTAIMAQMDPTEPLKWELKQKPGMSPPRGGFQPDDPNQQIVAEDIFDEYGGFLSGGNIPDLLTNISCKPKKRKSSKKSKHKRNSSPSSWDSDVPNQDGLSSSSDDDEKKSKKKKTKKKRRNYSGSSSSGGAEFDKHKRQRINKHSYSSEDSDSGRQYRTKESREKRSYTSEGSKSNPEPCGKKNRSKHSYSSADDFDRHYRKGKYKRSYTPEDSDSGRHDSKKKSTRKPCTLDETDTDRHRKSQKSRQRHSNSSDENHRHDRKSKNKHSYSSEDSDCHRHEPRKKTMRKPYNSEDSVIVRHNSRREKYRLKHHYSSEDDAYRHLKGEKSRHKHSSSCGYEDYSNSDSERRSKHHRRHH